MYKWSNGSFVKSVAAKFPDYGGGNLYRESHSYIFITAFIFGIIFKVLPDAKIEWRHVRVGAFTTAFSLWG